LNIGRKNIIFLIWLQVIIIKNITLK
jgi:hypothetical protein